MRKLFLTATIVVVLLSTVNAQVSFGFKTGANLSHLKASVNNITASSNTKLGVYAGAFLTLPVSATYNIQPEAVFSMEGAEDDNGVAFNLSYLNLPIMLQYNSSGFFVETGPQLGILLAAKAKEVGMSLDVKEGFEIINVSWAIGAGYRFNSRIGFDARYNFGLNNIAKTTSSEEGTLKSNVIQIGFTFPLNTDK